MTLSLSPLALLFCLETLLFCLGAFSLCLETLSLCLVTLPRLQVTLSLCLVALLFCLGAFLLFLETLSRLSLYLGALSLCLLALSLHSVALSLLPGALSLSRSHSCCSARPHARDTLPFHSPRAPPVNTPGLLVRVVLHGSLFYGFGFGQANRREGETLRSDRRRQ